MQAEKETPEFYLTKKICLIAMNKRIAWLRGAHGCFFVIFASSSWAVLVLNSDKAATWTITNYVNNESSERQFTPKKPQEKRKKRMIFRVYC